MCGIFGIVTVGNLERLPDKWRVAAAGSIRNRGPDHEEYQGHQLGSWQSHLFHSRLSILGLESASNQPLYSPCRRWVIIYNGEIYNYKELRDELLSTGEQFQTNGDTEVLLRCWIVWKEKALPKLNGMFAFAVVDLQEQHITLVRDRFGVKPLFTHFGKQVFFGSSLAGVAALVRANPNRRHIGRGLLYGVYETSTNESAFECVESMLPGTLTRLDFSRPEYQIRSWRWYDLSVAVSERKSQFLELSLEQLTRECRELLEDAIKLRLRADVPVAVSLSGGLDSSSIAGIARNLEKTICGFTYGSPTATQSEGPAVAHLADVLGLKVHYVWRDLKDSSLIDVFERTLAFQEAPIGFGGLSIMAQNEVYRAVREAGFKVLLGGQGGDECFAGYRKFFVVALREAILNGNPLDSLRHLWSLGTMLFAEAAQWRLYTQNIPRYLGRKSTESSLLNLDVDPINLWGEGEANLRSRQIEDISTFSLPTLLRYEDRNSMGFGVESRLPFMDYRLVEFALSLPATLKLSNGYGKWILRSSVQGIVPNHIRLTRMKRGFDVTQNWIEMGLGAHLREILIGNESVRCYCSNFSELEKGLTQQQLSTNARSVAEALTLAWLSKPIRISESA